MGEKLGFKDIIDLAKAGYKPADVKELLQLANEQKPVSEEVPVTVPKEETQPEAKKEPEAVSETQTEKQEDDTLKNLQHQVEDLKKQSDEKDKLIKQIQKENASRNTKTETQPKSEEDTLADIVRNFM